MRAIRELDAAAGTITVYRHARPAAIAPDSVTLQTAEGARTLPNDAVIACLGGTLPRDWLHRIGIAVETHHGQPVRTAP